MTKTQLIQKLQNHGMDFIYQEFHKMSEEQKRELLLSALFVIGNNNLESEYFNELWQELED